MSSGGLCFAMGSDSAASTGATPVTIRPVTWSWTATMSAAIEAVGPPVDAGSGIDQLGGHPHLVAGMTKTSLDQVLTAEFATYPLHVDSLITDLKR